MKQSLILMGALLFVSCKKDFHAKKMRAPVIEKKVDLNTAKLRVSKVHSFKVQFSNTHGEFENSKVISPTNFIRRKSLHALKRQSHILLPENLENTYRLSDFNLRDTFLTKVTESPAYGERATLRAEIDLQSAGKTITQIEFEVGFFSNFVFKKLIIGKFENLILEDQVQKLVIASDEVNARNLYQAIGKERQILIRFTNFNFKAEDKAINFLDFKKDLSKNYSRVVLSEAKGSKVFYTKTKPKTLENHWHEKSSEDEKFVPGETYYYFKATDEEILTEPDNSKVVYQGKLLEEGLDLKEVQETDRLRIYFRGRLMEESTERESIWVDYDRYHCIKNPPGDYLPSRYCVQGYWRYGGKCKVYENHLRVNEKILDLNKLPFATELSLGDYALNGTKTSYKEITFTYNENVKSLLGDFRLSPRPPKVLKNSAIGYSGDLSCSPAPKYRRIVNYNTSPSPISLKAYEEYDLIILRQGLD